MLTSGGTLQRWRGMANNDLQHTRTKSLETLLAVFQAILMIMVGAMLSQFWTLSDKISDMQIKIAQLEVKVSTLEKAVQEWQQK